MSEINKAKGIDCLSFHGIASNFKQDSLSHISFMTKGSNTFRIVHYFYIADYSKTI